MTLSYKNFTKDSYQFIRSTEIFISNSNIYNRLYYENENITIYNCTFNSLKSGSHGGAIYINSYLVQLASYIINSIFSKCMGFFGGTIYSSGLEYANTSIQNCTFLDNSAEFEGGALYFRNNFILTNCTFKNNSITYIITSNPMNEALSGGAIYCKDKSYSSIENCVFDNNSINCYFLQEDLNDLSYNKCYVYTYGGSIYFYSNKISIDNCIFYKNSLYTIIPNNISAGNYGAAFLISADDTKLNNCIFENNLNYLYSKYGAHGSYSGASYFIGENFTLSNCKYISNSLHIDCLSIWSIGGAVTCLNNGNSSIYNCYFKNNSIYKEGGGAAIYLERSFLSLNQSTFVENKFSNESLSSSYGAIYTSFVSIKMNNCYFINNECCNCSALYAYITPEHQTIINNCVFEFNKFLNFLRIIINNHHRNSDFFDKIEPILVYFKDDIKHQMSNLEIFKYFSENKRINYLLLKNQIIEIDDSIIDILSKPQNAVYFEPFLEMHYTGYPIKECDEKIKNGENDSYISQMIRKDLVVEFIKFMNTNNYPLDSKITKSIFETNPLLNEKAFYGSIQIFNYLRLNNVDLTPSLWIYAIHSKNGELIHILEENKVEMEGNTYEKCIIEAIKCHYKELINYFLQFDHSKKNYLCYYLQFYNYESMPNDPDSYSKCDLNFDEIELSFILNPEFLNLLFIESYLNINQLIDNETLLSMAIKQKKTDLIQFLLLNPKCNINQGGKALLNAVEKEDIQIIELLLSNKNIDPNIINEIANDFNGNPTKKAALSIAVEKENINIIKLLLSHPKIDPNVMTEKVYNRYGFVEKRTALSIAVEKENIDIIKLLLSHPKIDPNVMIEKQYAMYGKVKKRTALSLAIEKENIKIIEQLLLHPKIDPNVLLVSESNGNKGVEKTALSLAVEKENIKIIEQLLLHPKIDPNVLLVSESYRNKEVKKTALSLAIEKENNEIIKLLLACPNIDPNFIIKIEYQDNTHIKEERTALSLAIEKENIELIKLLLMCQNIDPNVTFEISKSDKGYVAGKRTALSMAIEKENTELIKLLLMCQNIDPNVIFEFNRKNNKYDSGNKTALSMAIEKEDAQLVELLLKCRNINIDAEINKKIISNEKTILIDTVFHLAIYKKNKNIIRLFFEHKRNSQKA